MPFCPQNNVKKLSTKYVFPVLTFVYLTAPFLSNSPLPPSFYMDHIEPFIVSSLGYIFSSLLFF